MIPSADDFEIWRENPVTAWVLKGLSDLAESAKTQALQMAWETPPQTPIDQAAINRLKMRHETYSDVAGLSYDDAKALHPNETPEEEA